MKFILLLLSAMVVGALIGKLDPYVPDWASTLLMLGVTVAYGFVIFRFFTSPKNNGGY